MAEYRINIRDKFAWQDPVIDKDLTTPAGGDAKGDRYIVGGSATGAWEGHDNAITYYTGSEWVFLTPVEGWICWVKDEDKYYKFDGTNWGEYLGQVGPTGPTGAQGGTGPTGPTGPTNQVYDADFGCLIITL